MPRERGAVGLLGPGRARDGAVRVPGTRSTLSTAALGRRRVKLASPSPPFPSLDRRPCRRKQQPSPAAASAVLCADSPVSLLDTSTLGDGAQARAMGARRPPDAKRHSSSSAARSPPATPPSSPFRRPRTRRPFPPSTSFPTSQCSPARSSRRPYIKSPSLLRLRLQPLRRSPSSPSLSSGWRNHLGVDVSRLVDLARSIGCVLVER